MKKLTFSVLAIFSFSLFIFTISCKKETDNPFNDEAIKAYEAAMSLQDESDDVLAGFEAAMDSAAAVEALAQWFRDHENVEWAVVSSQGISVSYTNGMYGGILLDPERYGVDQPGKSIPPDRQTDNLSPLKNLPVYKKARCVNAAMDEFFDQDAYQFNSWKETLNGIGYECVYNLNDEVSLDYLKNLTSRNNDGIISLNSHGYAWPGKTNIEEVYFLTGQEQLQHTTEVFYTDIIEKRVILLKRKDGRTRYYIAPDFLTKYNDFSNDTILFYGGFCYSFLGNWPSLVNSCASGTYFGFDWVVKSGKCAEWAVNLVDYMAIQDVAQPNTVEDWMTDSPIAKQYLDEKYNKTVHILYEGNGALTLWQPEYNAEGGIEALAPDKAPILVPGKTCAEYTLRCNVNGQLPPQVYYFWDLGHETAFNMNQTGNEVVGRWGLPGTYTVKVEVRNSSNDEVIEEFDTQVNIEDPSYLGVLKTNQYFELNFFYMNGPNITLTNGETLGNGFFDWQTYYFTSPLAWTDSSFHAESFTPSGNGGNTMTIQGEMSSDGKTIRHCLLTITKIHSDGQFDQESKLEIANMTIWHHDEWNCWESFLWNFEGAASQTYIQSIEYKKYDYQEQELVTIQSIDWGNSVLYGMFYNQ
jgi:hypothetical protein